jgi:transaldolase
MSIHPTYQKVFVTKDLPREERIDVAVPPDVIARLSEIPEFVRAYEPDGMAPSEFVGFGVTQRTLSQFSEVGWKPLENFR